MDATDDDPYNFGRVSEDYYVEALQTELPVYGDLLECMTVRLGDIPIEDSDTIFEVSMLVKEIDTIRHSMFEAYLDYSLLLAGYQNPFCALTVASVVNDDDPVHEHDDDDERFEDAFNEWFESFSIDDWLEEGVSPPFHLLRYHESWSTHNYYADGRTILPYLKEKFYVNRKDEKQGIRIILLDDGPWTMGNGELYFECITGLTVKKIAQSLHNPIHPELEVENFGRFVVIEPLINRLLKDKIPDFRNRLKIYVKDVKVVSVEEFINRHLKLNINDLKKRWKSVVSSMKGRVKMRHPFLFVKDDREILNRAVRLLDNARGSLNSELTQTDIERITLDVGRSLEGLLTLFLHANGKFFGENYSLGNLLDESNDLIIEKFGEDVLTDLGYVIEQRNMSAHVKHKIPDKKSAIKTVSKVDMFYRLMKDQFYKHS